MNLNELFFYKTIQCTKKEKHDFDICYFSHHVNGDKRRVNIDFNQFLKKYEIKLNDENEFIEKNLLNFYNNKIGFENDVLNGIIFRTDINPCKNQFEIKYHIMNFKQNECYFEKFNLKCVYQNLCMDLHKQEQKLDERIINLKTFFEKLNDQNKTISKFEIFEIYRKLYNCENKYIFTKYYMIDIETKLQLFKNPAPKINLNKNVLNNLKTKINKSNNLIKTNILKELVNIPVLSKEDQFSKLINTDNQIIYLTNTLPKKEELNKLLFAFLNSHKGVIIYGADTNTNKFTGIRMDRKTRDIFRQSFNTEYKDYLVEYNECLKYKFYDLDDNSNDKESNFSNNSFNSYLKNESLCIIVIKVKKVKENKVLFDPYNKAYTVKEKYLDRFYKNKEERINLSDVKQLNMKEYIEITRNKLIEYYK